MIDYLHNSKLKLKAGQHKNAAAYAAEAAANAVEAAKSVTYNTLKTKRTKIINDCLTKHRRYPKNRAEREWLY